MVIASGEMLLRLGTSILFGAAIGYERELSGRPAGLRTHLLVSLASALFMIVSTQFTFFQNYAKDDLVMVDTSRIAASVVSGVGFLGAGAILRTGLGIQGLTTAASLWLMAAIGLAAGSGMFLIATVTTVTSLIVLIYLRRFERKRAPLLQRQVEVVFDSGSDNVRGVIDRLRRFGADESELNFDHHMRVGKVRIMAVLRFPDPAKLEQLLEEMGRAPGVRRIKIYKPA